MVNIRNILIALPTVYLLVALVLMGGNRSPRLPQLNTVPQRVLMLTQAAQGPPPGVRGGFVAPAPAVAARAPAAAAAPAAGLTPAEQMAASSPAPPKPEGTPYKVKYYDGNSVTVFPHADLGQAGSDWWPVSAQRGARRGSAAEECVERSAARARGAPPRRRHPYHPRGNLLRLPTPAPPPPPSTVRRERLGEGLAADHPHAADQDARRHVH